MLSSPRFLSPTFWESYRGWFRLLLRLQILRGRVLMQVGPGGDAASDEDGWEETSFPQPSDFRKLHDLDPETITRIHQLYFSDVYRYARYRLPTDTLAEDIASEVFIQLLEAVHAGKGPRTSIRGWLMRTTSNLVNNHYRKHYATQDSELTEDIPTSEPVPEVIAEENERISAVNRAMQNLTLEQQNVLALRFGSGLSLAETAALMGKRANAIKALQFRALAALSRQLGDE